jgi:hypothetical protein
VKIFQNEIGSSQYHNRHGVMGSDLAGYAQYGITRLGSTNYPQRASGGSDVEKSQCDERGAGANRITIQFSAQVLGGRFYSERLRSSSTPTCIPNISAGKMIHPSSPFSAPYK